MASPSLEFRPFNILDLAAADVQFRHKGVLVEILELDLERRALLETPYAWTGWADGKPMACCGIYQGWAWAFLHWDLRRHMLAITRKVRAVLDSHPGPVRTTIDEAFPEAVRWATLLGLRRQEPGTWIYDAHLPRTD